jgi:hypothetical protein
MRLGKRKYKLGNTLLLWGFSCCFLFSCAPTAPPPSLLSLSPSPPPPPPLCEEVLPPLGQPDVFIFDLKDTVSEDKQALFVEGRIGNRGSQATKQIAVTVRALNEEGQGIARAEATPTPQALLPGGSAAFVVKLPNDPAIRRFHVEAVAY